MSTFLNNFPVKISFFSMCNSNVVQEADFCLFFNDDQILLASKWPVNSPIYCVQKLKPNCLHSSESQEIAVWEHCEIFVIFLFF